jgi:hypothetical protein
VSRTRGDQISQGGTHCVRTSYPFLCLALGHHPGRSRYRRPGPLLQKAGNPTNMGICVACFVCESGTHNAVGLAGLGAGVRWALDRGVETIRAHRPPSPKFRLRGMRPHQAGRPRDGAPGAGGSRGRNRRSPRHLSQRGETRFFEKTWFLDWQRVEVRK